MSKSRKHIKSEAINSYPELQAGQSIVKVVATRGTNQVEVECPNKEKILVMMPTKFNKLVWTKKGDHLIITTDRSEMNKGKIKGIIEHILVTHQIKHLKKIGQWPIEFSEKAPNFGPKDGEEPSEQSKPIQDGERSDEDENEDDSSSEEDEIYSNPNHQANFSDDETDSDEDSDDE